MNVRSLTKKAIWICIDFRFCSFISIDYTRARFDNRRQTS